MGLRANITYGVYEYGNPEVTRPEAIMAFDYDSDMDRFIMYDVFQHEFLPKYGQSSKFATKSDSYMSPYMVDKDGNFTTEDTRIIGGTNIPRGIMREFIKWFGQYSKVDVMIQGKKLTDFSDQNILLELFAIAKKDNSDSLEQEQSTGARTR